MSDATFHKHRRGPLLTEMASRWDTPVATPRAKLESRRESWPTPLASDSDGQKHQRSGNNRDDPRPNLPAKVATWPTPTSSMVTPADMVQATTAGNAQGRMTYQEAKEIAERKWPTPMATGEERGGNFPRGNPTLSKAMQTWPTPARTDSKDSARGTTTTGIMHPGTSLTDAMRGLPDPETKTDGDDTMVLVPEFVEALMGLPEGFTLVDGEHVWLAWVTLLCRSTRLRPLHTSQSGLPTDDDDDLGT